MNESTILLVAMEKCIVRLPILYGISDSTSFTYNILISVLNIMRSSERHIIL